MIYNGPFVNYFSITNHFKIQILKFEIYLNLCRQKLFTLEVMIAVIPKYNGLIPGPSYNILMINISKLKFKVSINGCGNVAARFTTTLIKARSLWIKKLF